MTEDERKTQIDRLRKLLAALEGMEGYRERREMIQAQLMELEAAE